MSDNDNNLYLMLGELKAGVEAIRHTLVQQNEDHSAYRGAVDTRLNSHGDRLTKLEQFRWKVAGVVLVVPVILTAVGLLISIT